LADIVQVAAGALFDVTGRVLIAQRIPGKHLAGRWEFPGGKIAIGESATQALMRELQEELGVVIHDPLCFQTLRHQYSDRCIELTLFIVERFEGLPQGLDGQALKWVHLEVLHKADILEADRPFIKSLQQRAALAI